MEIDSFPWLNVVSYALQFVAFSRSDTHGASADEWNGKSRPFENIRGHASAILSIHVAPNKILTALKIGLSPVRNVNPVFFFCVALVFPGTRFPGSFHHKSLIVPILTMAHWDPDGHGTAKQPLVLDKLKLGT